MSVTIKKISIKAFRGIPDLELALDGKSFLLRGENGTGKSSMVDAIEFFFTGRVSHLEGVRGLSLQRHGPHTNFIPNDVNVVITFDPGNVSLSRTFTSVPTPPSLLEDYFRTTQKGTFILRRSQILAFIISQPAERFRSIGSILGIDPLDNVELEMMRVRDELEGEVSSKKREIDNLIKEVSDIIGKNITSVDEILTALNQILETVNLPLIKSLEKVDEHSEEMLKSVKKTESLDKIRILNEILESAKVPLITEETINDLSDLNERVSHLLGDNIRLELSVADLLQIGRRVIEQEKLEFCPLCEHRIDREGVLARINERLNTLRDLSDEASAIRKISVPIIDNLKIISDKLRSTISKIELFTELSEEKEILSEKLILLNGFIDKVVSAKELRNEIPIQEISQQKEEINRIGRSISTKCSQLLENIGLTDEEKKVLEVVRLIEQARGKAKDLLRVSSELKTYQRYYDLAKKIYTAFSDAKKSKIQKIYNSIQGDIQRFYSMIHPKEPHGNIKLIVAQGRRASTELKIKSFGRDGEDPRALTSEGHLDSLGLCIFLAFVKKFNEGCPLVILDDVVTTIDAAHRGRIAELLLKEFKNFQLIISTHDGIWYEQLINMQRALNIQGNFKNMEIIAWDVNTGPRIRPYKPRWERIQDKLRNNDKTSAGNECRIYLEWILKKICENLEVPVPFKSNGRYTVAELFDPAEKRIKDKLKDCDLKSDILDKFRKLRATRFMGNLLSHDNPEIESLSVEEVKDFCDAVHNLHEVFLCPKCGHFIRYYHDLKIIRCPNPRCKDPVEVKTK